MSQQPGSHGRHTRAPASDANFSESCRCRGGTTVIQQWRDGSDAAPSTIASAQNTIFDPDLLVTFAHISEHLLEDNDAAELFYRRAFEQPNTERTAATWFWIYFLLARGRRDEAISATGGISHFINWLQATSVELETRGVAPEREAFLGAFSKYTPITGASGAEACTLWELLYNEAPPDSVTLPAIRLLGHGRAIERQLDLSAARTEYDAALAAALAPPAPPAIAAMVTIVHLRYLRRLQLDGKLGAANLVTQWRAADAQFHSNTEFRKQYLAYLIVSGNLDAAEQLRTEFLAYRSAT